MGKYLLVVKSAECKFWEVFLLKNGFAFLFGTLEMFQRTRNCRKALFFFFNLFVNRICSKV